MRAPAFAHLRGRTMWAHCDHWQTRLEGTPAAVVLAAGADPGTAPDGGPGLAPAVLAAWRSALGSAVVIPCPPDQCTESRVLAAGGGRPLAVLGPEGWQALPIPAPAPTPPGSILGLELEPGASTPAPKAPDGLALDPWGRLWVLDRPGGRLLLLDPDLRIQAAVPLPPGFDPLAFGCAAFGLTAIDAAGPRLLVQPWGGAWTGWSVPDVASGEGLASLAADPAWPLAVALLRGGAGYHRVLVVRQGGVAIWPLPMVGEPLQLLITGPDRFLVGELARAPGDPRPFQFREIRLTDAGPEAEAGFAVRGFDGRALWRLDGAVYASTKVGARVLFPLESGLVGEGQVETFALDSGVFRCTWHRLFLDCCLPPGCGIAVEAKTADELPPFAVRRGRRLRPDEVPAGSPGVVSPSVDDPWPPLGSLVVDETEGWVPLGLADSRRLRVDQPLCATRIERPSEDPLAASRGPETTLPAGAGSQELLILAPPGRYLWLRLRLIGTSRRGPRLFALRASFPRPSLLDYLPAYWRVDPEGGESTERALALFEGWLTELHGRVDRLPRLFDPRITPPEVLDWLASFLALALDGRVREGVRRQLLDEIAVLYRARGTVPGLTRMLSILAECQVQIIEGFRLRRPTAAFLGEAPVGPGLELGGREGAFGLATDEDWEQALAAGYLELLARRAAQPYPCPAQPPSPPVSDDPLIAFYRRHAHRFTVVVPRPCDAILGAVLEQAIESNKPAHTIHRVCWLDTGYRLGSASLVGISHLGPVARPAPAVLGEAWIASLATLGRVRPDDRYPNLKPLDPWGTAQ